MYDNEKLELTPETARALGYEVPAPVRRQPRVAQVPAPQHYANPAREEGGFIPALLMLLGAGVVLLVLIVGGIALLGHLAKERMAVNTEPPQTTEAVQNPDLPRRII